MTSVGITTGTMSIIGDMGLEIKGIAGEALGVGNACKIGSDGLVQQSVSTEWLGASGTNAVIDFDGICPQAYVAGDAVSLYGKGSVIANYGASLVVGTPLYVSATAGILSDVKVASIDMPVAKVISATDILILR